MNNIFAGIPCQISEEIFETLVSNDCVRIERILSKGQVTAYEEWYDQNHDEWILIMQGQAVLRYEDPAQSMRLTPGDHVLIPAHQKHRVEWTDPNQTTVWLAVHWQHPANKPE